ncbi:hypothetical protein PPYR_08467 [Photinus pyralis]|uniref:Major facilitator superfamily (MFS) profile domain-containing protein n=1 Tax=Photinus pyralis TaxID=7054 RepID=A0A5N4AJJ9_PHOPY|nr:monocarboxylate transporter 5 [Photinus pyralis]KAB0797474.1 hypothetical protein PPYR_08467 [Photinus pyralis]
MTLPLPAKNSEDEEDQDSELPPPPDGGWGWAVVFGSFMIHIITDGVTYSFGVFYDEFLGYFNEGKGPTAWILSILVGITLCSGPISSAFVNRWGCRAVTIAGAILGSVCMIISSFAQNVTTLYFTIGIGTGLGFGLIYLPAIVSVTTYFEKKRSLATGIAVCGSGLGTFIFAPLINLLLREYGWRGAMLIVSALVLECIIFGALFRPLEYDVKPPKGEVGNTHTSPKTDLSVSHDRIDVYANGGNSSKSDMKRPKSMTLLLDPQKNGKMSYNFSRSQPALNSSHYEPLRHRYGSQNLKRSRPVFRQDAFYQYSIQNLAIFKSKLDVKEASEVEKMIRKPSIHSRHKHSETEETKTTVCGFIPCSEETKETLYEMLNLSLLKDPIFILFTVSNFCTSIGFNIPYVYIVSKAKSLGISSDNASILLSIIGIANTIGRIVLGYVSDNPKINRLFVYNMCLTICGVATALSAFCVDFYSLAFYGTIFGFTIGAYVGLTSVILVDLLGLEKLTNAFGLLLLFQGIASLIGPPIAGELYDSLASYDPGFYVSGVTIAISGLILFAIPPLQRWQARRTNIVEARNGNV